MRLALLALSASLLTGCAGITRTVGRAELPEASLDLSGRSVTVVLADGARYAADAFRLEADTTTWVNPTTGNLMLVPTANIALVEHRQRGRSALRTAGAGVLVAGSIVGVLGGLMCSSDLGCDGVGGMVLTGVSSGALYGAIGGSIANRPDRWRFAQPDSAASTSGGGVEGGLVSRSR